MQLNLRENIATSQGYDHVTKGKPYNWQGQGPFDAKIDARGFIVGTIYEETYRPSDSSKDEGKTAYATVLAAGCVVV